MDDLYEELQAMKARVEKCWELPADEFNPYLRATSQAQGLSYHLAMAIKAIEETWILK